ncbi:MAG: hypothetical protein ACP5GY_05275 [Vulcanisaeta sp.]
MLVLIHGSLGLDYLVHNVLPNNDWLISMICRGNEEVSGINIDLRPGITARIAILWGRVLDLQGDEGRLLLDALLNSVNLHDAIDYVLETYADYNAHRLYYFMKIMNMLNIWKPMTKGCIPVPLIEPIKTLVASVVLAYIIDRNVKGSLILTTDFIDEIKDALQEARGLGNVYVVTNHIPRDIGIFDDLIVSTSSIPQETFGKLMRISGGNSAEVIIKPIGLSIISNNFEGTKETLDSIGLEIVRTVNELGFTTMNSLVDMVSQTMGVTKEEVLKALIKVSNMNLVRIRYLSDGRAILTPTISGLRITFSK